MNSTAGFIAAALDAGLLDPEDQSAFTYVTSPTGHRELHAGSCPRARNDFDTTSTSCDARTVIDDPRPFQSCGCATDFELDENSHAILVWIASANSLIDNVDPQQRSEQYLRQIADLHAAATGAVLDPSPHAGVEAVRHRTLTELLEQIDTEHRSDPYQAALAALTAVTQATWDRDPLEELRQGAGWASIDGTDTWYGLTQHELGWDNISADTTTDQLATWLRPQVWVNHSLVAHDRICAYSTAFDPRTYDGRDGRVLYRLPVAVAAARGVRLEETVAAEVSENFDPGDVARVRSIIGTGNPRRARDLLTALTYTD